MSNILVFDSGVGGISVVREIKQLLPSVSIDYLFDNLYYPYGELDESTLIQRIIAVIDCVAIEHKPQLIVIACNSASTIALPTLRAKFDIPIVGVVPAIKPASKLSNSKVIGLLATQGTITRDYIEQLKINHASDCELVNVGSNELVAMAENLYRGGKVSQQRLLDICQPIFERADVMILGCTHFPLLVECINQIKPPSLVIIDSGLAIAQRVKALLDVKAVKTKTPHNFLNHRALYTKSIIDKSLISALFSEGFNEATLINLPHG